MTDAIKNGQCRWTASTIRASRDDNWSKDLKAHAGACESCRTARWMGGLAGVIDSRATALPDPELIWLKAGIRQRSQPQGRALLPLWAAQCFGGAGMGLLLAIFPGSLWQWTSRAGELAPNLTEALLAVLSQPQALFWLLPAGALLLLLLAFAAAEA